MPDNIIPYPNRNDIAIVNRETSGLIQKGLGHEDPNVIRVTDVYVGRYGNLGYVEINFYSLPKIDVGGIIEIPGSLVDAMEKVRGMKGYVTEVVFGNQDFPGDLEWLDSPSLKGAKLFDTKYYWYTLGYHVANPLEVAKLIKEDEDDVIKFISKFEKVLDTFIRTEQKPDFQKLLSLGTHKMLENI